MRNRYTIILTSLLIAAAAMSAAEAALEWVSPNHYRVLLTVDPKGRTRTNSPASVDIDLPGALVELFGKGIVDMIPDENTIEVVGYDAAGKARVYDASKEGYEKHLLPWRIERYFGITSVTLSFVMPDEKCTQYAVYFDTVDSGFGKPKRYPGLVGDGDRFVQAYGRREINGHHFDKFCDFDRDGDLDLFKGGIDPWVYYYENVGGNRYVPRGRLTSEGKLMSLPWDKQRRSWVTIEFCDWDGDGDLDFFPSFSVGYSSGNTRGNTWIYENTTPPGGPLTFADRGPLLTVTSKTLGMLGSFAGIKFVDLDGDGKRDFVLQRDSVLEFHKNIGTDNKITEIKLADAELIKANGEPWQVSTAQFDFADIDSDGDLDLFCGSQHGHVYWFENLGSKTKPVFGLGRMIVFHEFLDAHSGVTVADFDGDGLLDLVVGRFWERTTFDHQPRFFGRLYRNVGTKKKPHFRPVDSENGAPYTEGFQICDAVRQNSARAVDWDSDGKTDLLAGDCDGFVWFFKNTTNELSPVFMAGVKLTTSPPAPDNLPLIGALGSPRGGRQALRLYPNTAHSGYAKMDVTDWNNDGLRDLIVLEACGQTTLYLNNGSVTQPRLARGVVVEAGGKPISIGGIGSALMVCDWNSDGKKDLVMSSGVFFFLENTGADASPVFAEPKRVLFGPDDKGDTEYWLRPSASSFLDWDGDGANDLIAGEFETGIKLYRNVGPAGPGLAPQFADPNGIFIVRPPVGMQVSGADAKDWNGDGDVDILTGQGHGGSGMRLFERDYIEDFVNDTFPVVTVGTPERKTSP